MTNYGAAGPAAEEMAKKLEDAKDNLKIMTAKFASARKERD